MDLIVYSLLNKKITNIKDTVDNLTIQAVELPEAVADFLYLPAVHFHNPLAQAGLQSPLHVIQVVARLVGIETKRILLFLLLEIVNPGMLVMEPGCNLLQLYGKGLLAPALPEAFVSLLQFLLHVQRRILLEGRMRALQHIHKEQEVPLIFVALRVIFTLLHFLVVIGNSLCRCL